MFQHDKELVSLIVAGTIMVLLLGIFIISFLFFYQKKHNTYLDERDVLQSKFQNELVKAQYEVQEQTMQTIGADLHDNIGQLLSLTSLTLHSIETEDVLKARQKIDAAIELTMHSIKEMRQLGKLLQGDQLVVLGLSEAIRYEINWLERSGNFEVSYLEDGEMPAGNSPDKDLILFRILQEILNNIIKHAKATLITIKLGYLGGKLHLKIMDNGIGFNPDELFVQQHGMGLHNIRKRAGIIGGEVSITSKLGEGTSLIIITAYP